MDELTRKQADAKLLLHAGGLAEIKVGATAPANLPTVQEVTVPMLDDFAAYTARFDPGHRLQQYVRRWLVRDGKSGRIIVHVYDGGDDYGYFHDHTRHHISWVLRGTLVEEIRDPAKPDSVVTRLLSSGDVVYRNNDFQHHFTAVSGNPITMVFAGPKTKTRYYNYPADDPTRQVPSHEVYGYPGVRDAFHEDEDEIGVYR